MQVWVIIFGSVLLAFCLYFLWKYFATAKKRRHNLAEHQLVPEPRVLAEEAAGKAALENERSMGPFDPSSFPEVPMVQAPTMQAPATPPNTLSNILPSQILPSQILPTNIIPPLPQLPQLPQLMPSQEAPDLLRDTMPQPSTTSINIGTQALIPAPLVSSSGDSRETAMTGSEAEAKNSSSATLGGSGRAILGGSASNGDFRSRRGGVTRGKQESYLLPASSIPRYSEIPPHMHQYPHFESD
jgi:hypothetical protein